MYAFDYHKPGSVADAVSLLKGSDGAKLMSGGQTFIPTLKQRLAAPDAVIDLAGIAELKGVCLDGDILVIGAMTTHAEVASSEVVRSHSPWLADLAQGIGDPQVRNRGTIGGAIANADPAADYPAAVLALNATIRTDRREIPADDMFTGLFETALAEDEVITAIAVPKADMAAYAKFDNPASRYAIVGVMVARFGGSVRIGLTGAGPSADRMPDVEEALAARFAPETLDGIDIRDEDFNTDIHATAAYRQHLVKVMAKRAVQACL